VSELERLAAAELMNGNLEGNRDVHICAFELVGKEAFGKVPAALVFIKQSEVTKRDCITLTAQQTS
jgi:hypothetical protein